MSLGSREKVFTAMLGSALLMFGAGTSLFSQPVPLSTTPPPPSETPDPGPVVEIAWADLAHRIEGDLDLPSVPTPRRPPHPAPMPTTPIAFSDLEHWIAPWTSPLEESRADAMTFRTERARPRRPIPAPPRAPPADMTSLELLNDLKISGLIHTARFRAVHLGGARLRAGDRFDLVQGKVVRREKGGGLFRLKELKPDSLVLEHIPSGSTLIRSSDRKRR